MYHFFLQEFERTLRFIGFKKTFYYRPRSISFVLMFTLFGTCPETKKMDLGRQEGFFLSERAVLAMKLKWIIQFLDLDQKCYAHRVFIDYVVCVNTYMTNRLPIDCL